MRIKEGLALLLNVAIARPKLKACATPTGHAIGKTEAADDGELVNSIASLYHRSSSIAPGTPLKQKGRPGSISLPGRPQLILRLLRHLNLCAFTCGPLPLDAHLCPDHSATGNLQGDAPIAAQ